MLRVELGTESSSEACNSNAKPKATRKAKILKMNPRDDIPVEDVFGFGCCVILPDPGALPASDTHTGRSLSTAGAK